MNLISVDDATARITAGLHRLPAEAIPLLEALGRVLAGPVSADRDLPAQPTSSMDGFAVRAVDAAVIPATVRLAMDIPAGALPAHALQAGDAARIMTGAIVPPGADAVVPVEHTDQQWEGGSGAALGTPVQIRQPVHAGDAIRQVGSDLATGQRLLDAGTVLRAPEIGLLAALGRASVSVIRQPVVAILSTGDELAQPGTPLLPGQIYDANSFALASVVQSWGARPIRIPAARDTLESVRTAFRIALDAAPDLILSSAGVSVGAHDVVRTVMEELGTLDFWRVNVRPGKPLAFGQIGGIPLIGLPGNPVSAMVTADLFVRPALAALSGLRLRAEEIDAVCAEPLTSDGRRSYLRVTLRHENGRWLATTTGTQRSSALLGLVLADALLIIPEGVTEIAPGVTCRIRLLRPLPAAVDRET